MAGELQDRIRKGEFGVGEQFPTEEKLARSLKVSRVTLRTGLGMLEERGLIRRTRGKGTFLNGDHYDASAVGALLYIGNYKGHLFDRLYQAMATECQRIGCPITAYEPVSPTGSEDDCRKIKALLPNARSAIVSRCHWNPAPAEDPLNGFKRVYVDYVGASVAPGFHVALDVQRGMQLAAEALLEAGHRRFLYVGADPAATDKDPFVSCQPKPVPAYSGFRAALAQVSDAEHRALAACVAEREAEDLYARALKQLDGWATAAVCNHDYRAMLLSHAAAAVGVRIPAALSVVGIGNTPWSEAMRPKLTTVSLGEENAAFLAVHLCGFPAPSEPIVYTANPRLLKKESVKRRRT